MAFAQGSRSSLSYIVESTFGTTPSGNFTTLPFTSHSLNLTKDIMEGNDIQSDRMPRVNRQGNRQTSGDIAVDLRRGDFDPLLEAAMLSTWSSDILKVGTTPKFFSIEDYASDIDQARLFTGMTVSTLSISMAPNQMVSTTFGMVGKDMSISQTQKTLNASSTNAPFDAYSGSIGIGAIGTGTPSSVAGSDSAPSLEYGRAEVSGTISAYFEDAALINRFLNETETGVQVIVNDPTGSNPYTFKFPRCKINSADVGVDGPTSRIVSMEFVGLYDTGEASNMEITRTS